METSRQDFNQLNQTQRRIAHDEMVLTTEIDWLGTSTPQLQAGLSGSENKVLHGSLSNNKTIWELKFIYCTQTLENRLILKGK